jgi:hypothetical protein
MPLSGQAINRYPISRTLSKPFLPILIPSLELARRSSNSADD